MQDSYSARYNLTKFLFPAAILLCFIIAYWTSYQKMSIRWSGGDNNYCYLVVPLFLYLCWDRRKKPSADGGQRLEAEKPSADGGQRLEVGGQRSEVRDQRSEVRYQRSEARERARR